MEILNGKYAASKSIESLKESVDGLPKKHGFTRPGLAVVTTKESSSLIQTAEMIGFKTHLYSLSKTVSYEEAMELIKKLNSKKKVDGIVVHIPLPNAAQEEELLRKIKRSKDVAGFSKGISCVPQGIVALLKTYDIPIEGKHCVIIGKSETMGKQMAGLMLDEDATVTVCHCKTQNLKDICLTADILISAVNKPGCITQDMVKPEAVAVDAGSVGDFSEDVEALYKVLPESVKCMAEAVLLDNVLSRYLRKLVTV